MDNAQKNNQTDILRAVVIGLFTMALAAVARPLLFSLVSDHFGLEGVARRMVDLDLFVLKRMRQIEGLRNSDYFVHRVVVHRGSLYRLFYDRHFDPRLQSVYEEESMKLLQSSTRTPKQLLAKESVWMAALNLCNNEHLTAKRYTALAYSLGLHVEESKIKPLEKCGIKRSPQ
ncbi:MAG: hypothetical protein ACT4QB_22870 [Gammaproteobacteria bacterium]